MGIVVKNNFFFLYYIYMTETIDINKLLETNKILEKKYKEKKQKDDLAGVYTNLLLYCNNNLALLGEPDLGIDKEDLKEKFQELKDIQEQVKSKMSGGRGNDDAEESRVKQHVLDPCDKRNCLLYRDVIGLEDQKRQILESFAYPIMFPKLYPRGTKGMLFYGPPGTGKTYIMKATVNQLQLMDENLRVLYYSPTGAELKGKYVGETEKNIKAYFDVASKNAKSCEKKNNGKKYISIIFIDEVEAIAGDRASGDSLMTNSVNTLLQMMDGVNSHENVAVVAATNYPWNLDSAILRRLQKRIHIKLPGYNEINQLMDFELDRYVNVKSFIGDFDVSEFCKNKERDNTCQTEVCQFDDNSEESMYEEYDAKWKKTNGILMNNEIDSLLRYNSSKCVGANIVEEDKPPHDEESFDTPENEKKEDAEKDRPGFSNSDVSNYMNNVFTNAATRVKEGNFILTRIKDELVYLYEGSSYNLFPAVTDPKADWVSENIIKKKPDYELEYLKKISAESFMESTSDKDKAELDYLKAWITKNLGKGIDEYIAEAKRSEAYLDVPPPPSAREIDDQGNYIVEDITFCDFLKKKALSSGDFVPEIKSTPKNENTLEIKEDTYELFTDVTQSNIDQKIEKFLKENLTKLLNDVHVQYSFDNPNKKINFIDFTSYKQDKYKEFYKLKKYEGLFDIKNIKKTFVSKLKYTKSKEYKFKDGENDEKKKIFTLFKRKIMTVCDEIRGKFYVKTSSKGSTSINSSDLEFLLTFETEVKNKNNKRIKDLCYHCYGFINYEKLLQFVFDDIFTCLTILSMELKLENPGAEGQITTDAGGGKKTKKNIKYKNLTKKKQIGGETKYIEPIYDTQLISIMSDLSNFEKMLFNLNEINLSKNSINQPNVGTINCIYLCELENLQSNSKIYFCRMLSELTKKTTSGKNVKENEYNKDQIDFDDSEEVDTNIDKYIEDTEPSAEESSPDFFDMMFIELKEINSKLSEPIDQIDAFNKEKIQNIEVALSLNNKIQPIVTNLEKFKDLESDDRELTPPEESEKDEVKKEAKDSFNVIIQAKLPKDFPNLKGKISSLPNEGFTINQLIEIGTESDSIVNELVEGVRTTIKQIKDTLEYKKNSISTDLEKTIKEDGNLKSELEKRRKGEIEIENLDCLLKLLSIINPKDPQVVKRYQAIKQMDSENGDMSFDKSTIKIINILKKKVFDQIMEIINTDQDIKNLLDATTETAEPTTETAESTIEILKVMIQDIKTNYDIINEKKYTPETEQERVTDYNNLLEQILVFTQKTEYTFNDETKTTIEAINSLIVFIKEILDNNKEITESVENKKIDYFTNNKKGILLTYIINKQDKTGNELLINKFFTNFFKITWGTSKYFTKTTLALSTAVTLSSLYLVPTLGVGAAVGLFSGSSAGFSAIDGIFLNSRSGNKLKKEMETLFVKQNEEITVNPIIKQSEEVSTTSYKHLLRNFHLDQGDFNEAFRNIKSSINPVEVLRLNHYDKTNRNPCTDEEFLKENKSAECSKK